RDPFVGSRQHACQLKGGWHEPLRQSIDFEYVVRRIASDAIGVRLIGRPDLGAGHVLAIDTGETEEACRLLEPMASQVWRDHAIATPRVLRVDPFTPATPPAQERLGALAAVENVRF